jgi:hypothetical protein
MCPKVTLVNSFPEAIFGKERTLKKDSIGASARVPLFGPTNSHARGACIFSKSTK